MTYEVTRWLPAVIKAGTGTFYAWSLSRRQAASTKQVALQALYIWTGNDIEHANWCTHIDHANAWRGQPILEQGLNLRASENEIMSCDVNIQKICWCICYSVRHECFNVINVSFRPFIPINNIWNSERFAVWGDYFREFLLFCVKILSASFFWLNGPSTCHVSTAATYKTAVSYASNHSSLTTERRWIRRINL